MPNITTCTRCGRLYEAGSDEQANEPGRRCAGCYAADRPLTVKEANRMFVAVDEAAANRRFRHGLGR